MTPATTTALKPRERERLLARVDQLQNLDRLMRQPGTLAAPTIPQLTQLTAPRRPQ